MPYNPFNIKKLLNFYLNPFHANPHTTFGLKTDKSAKYIQYGLERDIRRFKKRVESKAIIEINIGNNETISINNDNIDDVLAMLNNEEQIVLDAEMRIREEIKIHPTYKNIKSENELDTQREILQNEKLHMETLREEFNIPDLKNFIIIPKNKNTIESKVIFNKKCSLILENDYFKINENIMLKYF